MTTDTLKARLLQKTTFDDECRQFHEEHKENFSFQNEYYMHKLSSITFMDFLCLLDGGFFRSVGDSIPEFSFYPESESYGYQCSLAGSTYPDNMVQVTRLRLFEQKMREAIIGQHDPRDMMLWKTLLEITDAQFQENFPVWMGKLMNNETI
jgi:hypothetical protein